MSGQFNFARLAAYTGDMEQLADARMSVLAEGPGRGSRIISFRNGAGLAFTVTPDRGMDIVDCSFRGIPVAFRTPVGYANPERYEPLGAEWLRNWPGGLMTTAGLRNVGPANGEFGLHGRISNQAAGDVGIRRGVESGGYRLEAVGTLRESRMFGEHLELRRSIATGYGDNTITVCDEVTNLAALDDYLQMLYHCNFGYPFASPELEFEAEEHEIVPRDGIAAAGIAEWNRLCEPVPDYREQCFFHRLPRREDGTAGITVLNRMLGIRISMCWSADTLPNFVEWKNCLAGGYALGLEPTNASLAGRTREIEAGTARKIRPGETVRFRLQFRFETV